jgi:hypothetical protein
MSIAWRRSGLSKSCEMTASHCCARSAGTRPLKGMFFQSALTPKRLAISSPISISEPIGLVLGSRNSSGGPVMSEQSTIIPASAMRLGASGVAAETGNDNAAA